MNLVDSIEVIEELIRDNEMVLIYFGGESCSVCNAVKPKIEELLKSYPKVKSIHVDVEKSLRVSAAYGVFTIPVILTFIEGKEIIREARCFSIQDIGDKISRYYNLLFE